MKEHFTRQRSKASNQFAKEQRQRLMADGLNSYLVSKLVELTGPTWAVAVWRAYRINRKKFGDRWLVERQLRQVDLGNVHQPEDIMNAMRMQALIPPNQADATQSLTVSDGPRLVAGMLYLAGRL